MDDEVDIGAVATAMWTSLGLIRRQLRQQQPESVLSLPESAALTRLDRGGPATASALARLEQISPQSMGTTLGGLEGKGLVERRPDPADGRRIMLSVSEAGLKALQDKRDARKEQLARALSADFSADELKLLMAAAPLIERLALSI